MNPVCLVFIAILFPPAAVAIEKGFGSVFFLNLLLTICGYIPGHIHAYWVLCHEADKKDRERKELKKGYQNQNSGR